MYIPHKTGHARMNLTPALCKYRVQERPKIYHANVGFALSTARAFLPLALALSLC